jgi:hypothetical protein
MPSWLDLANWARPENVAKPAVGLCLGKRFRKFFRRNSRVKTTVRCVFKNVRLI